MLNALLKAPVVGIIATLLVSTIVYWLEKDETFLLIFRGTIEGFSFYWSWPTFIGLTVLSFGVFWMTE